ncbi:MAG: molybdopterin-guanine dinucleotide biosynthesis protein B [Burkholderiaceae bacterium]|jgi:molybdopterin-guanine dinucleotide biosynthesis protein B|nr:molybdopterin-guanine dinucleotide biosynthesis protein B [Burkholderiaceae bacterium]
MSPRFLLLGIAGWSGSGKTTLLERILPLLIARGYRVNVIKSSHHDVQIEPERKDSARLRAAGAAEVMLSSPNRYMLVHELRGEAPPELETLAGRMRSADMTLVEGFRDAAIPKLEVFRSGTGKEAMYPEDRHIVAVASDASRPDDLPRQLDWLDLNDPEAICDWLLEHRRKR